MTEDKTYTNEIPLQVQKSEVARTERVRHMRRKVHPQNKKALYDAIANNKTGGAKK